MFDSNIGSIKSNIISKLLFKIDKYRFAINASQCIEIVSTHISQSIQLTPNEIAGFISYQDKIIPVINLRVLLGISEFLSFETKPLIVINVEYNKIKKTMAVIIDELLDFIDLDPIDESNLYKQSIGRIGYNAQYGDLVITSLNIDYLLSCEKGEIDDFFKGIPLEVNEFNK